MYENFSQFIIELNQTKKDFFSNNPKTEGCEVSILEMCEKLIIRGADALAMTDKHENDRIIK